MDKIVTAWRLLAVALTLGAIACDAGGRRVAKPAAPASDPAIHRNPSARDAKGERMRITIGSKAFKVTPEDNPTAGALRALLPLRLNMTELNGNEKYYDLSAPLPANASRPETIRAGDLMLYGDNTLVLFYRTFKTPYSYTRIGRIDDPTGLAAAVGAGDVSVTFERCL